MTTKSQRDITEDAKNKIKRNKENLANLITDLESGQIYSEDLGEEQIDRLLTLLKLKEE